MAVFRASKCVGCEISKGGGQKKDVSVHSTDVNGINAHLKITFPSSPWTQRKLKLMPFLSLALLLYLSTFYSWILTKCYKIDSVVNFFW